MGNFNARAAKALSSYVDVRVFHLRAWKPNRPIAKRSVCDGVPVLTVAVPQSPRHSALNVIAYRLVGWPLVRATLRDCDLVHSVGAEFAAAVGSCWAEWAGAHHTIQLTGGEINAGNPRFVRRELEWKLSVHGVASNSGASAAAFRNKYPETPNVRTVYRGVDVDHYSPDGPVAGPLANVSPVRFLFLGGFPSYPDLPAGANTKGGETLLAAWAESEEKLARAGSSLLIAGPAGDGPRIAKWRATLRHPERVHATGVLHPDSVAAHIRASDAVLIPSLQEGLPNVAMEAGACGRAVLASDVGGLPEVIAHGVTGLLLPPGDTRSWGTALAESASAIKQLRGMGTRARKRMESSFDARSYATEMVDLFHAALREPRSPKQHEPKSISRAL